MTEDRKMKLRAAQRQMLRKIVGTRRRVTKGVYANSESSSSGSVFSGESVELEPWIEFLQRATHRADEYAKLYSVRDWVTTHYRYKLRLAGHMGRRTDDRWSRKVLYWIPADGSRARGHPCKRWTDELDGFFKEAHGLAPGEWLLTCKCRESWVALSDAFVDYCMK